MFKPLTLLALGVFSVSPLSAAPFTPDRFRLTAAPTVINDTVLVTLDPNGIGAWNPRTNIEAPAAMGSWLASNFCEPGSFTLDVELTLWDSMAPDLVSVTAGQLTGTYASDGFGMLHGVVNTAPIYTVSFAYPYVPNVPTSFIVLIDKPHDPSFTPLATTELTSVPEPSTLLLLGPALAILRGNRIATVLLRYRRQR